MGVAAIMAAASVCLFGVGGGPSDGSTAVPLATADANRMAEATTSFLAVQLPPAATTLYVVGPAGCDRRDTYTPALTTALRQAGYALAADVRLNPAAHVVKYHVTEGWQDSVILRLQLDNRETTQLFVRGPDGVLREAGPLTIKE